VGGLERAPQAPPALGTARETRAAPREHASRQGLERAPQAPRRSGQPGKPGPPLGSTPAARASRGPPKPPGARDSPGNPGRPSGARQPPGPREGPPSPPALGTARETRAAPREHASRRGLERAPQAPRRSGQPGKPGPPLGSTPAAGASRELPSPPALGGRLQLAPALGDFGEEIHGLCHALELAVLVGLMSER
jgi:hypothetical protein